MTRRIWLCADDYGISPAVNIAIRDLVVRGRINATSVMVTAPTCQPAEARALDSLNTGKARVSIGLHVTLSAPFRPLTATFRPLRHGAFPPLPVMLMRGLLRQLDTAVIEAEVASQIAKFGELFGRAPDFLDGHQHVQIFPQIRDAVLKVAKAKAPEAWVRQCGRVASRARAVGDRKGFLLETLSRGFRRRAATLGVATNPAFAGTYDYRDTADFAVTFPRFLDQLPDGSVVMCHPGFVDAELQKLDTLTTLREREYAFLVDDAFPVVLERHGVALH